MTGAGLVHTVTLKSNHYRCSEIALLCSSNDPLGNLITTNDSSKYIHKYSIYLKANQIQNYDNRRGLWVGGIPPLTYFLPTGSVKVICSLIISSDFVHVVNEATRSSLNSCTFPRKADCPILAMLLHTITSLPWKNIQDG